MGKRITIRLDDESHENLRKRSQEVGLDVSFLLRQAINKYLEEGAAGQVAKCAAAIPGMPAEAFSLEGDYRAWSGDLRKELRRQFLQLLAVAHTTADHWPRTAGIREVYVGLLELGRYLEIGNGV